MNVPLADRCPGWETGECTAKVIEKNSALATNLLQEKGAEMTQPADRTETEKQKERAAQDMVWLSVLVLSIGGVCSMLAVSLPRLLRRVR
mmetsp:Transcript_2778/g.4727  ORF Transcript_2778/g.4727 Transcript_2778/m.4727 type:complete len:90 (+) Transcript_2778:127-396(+)